MTLDTSPSKDSLTPHDAPLADATPKDGLPEERHGEEEEKVGTVDGRDGDAQDGKEAGAVDEKLADAANEPTTARHPSHLPSPPLTRSNTRESTNSARRADRTSDDEKIGAWHPLHDEAKREAETKRESASDARPDLTVIVEDGEQVVDSHGRVLFPDDVSDAGAGKRRTSHLHLDLSRSRELQPWDLVDPPGTGDESKGAWGGAPRNFGTGATTPRALIPRSAYFTGLPPPDAAFGTAPVGQIGVHHPREIVRIERDYSGGELVQFAPIYPLELEGRITPTQFLESVNAINELLILAHSTRHAFVDNTLAVLTLQLSRLFVRSHYDRMMQRLKALFDELNAEIYNPAGLNILWPRKVAFLFLEIEYY